MTFVYDNFILLLSDTEQFVKEIKAEKKLTEKIKALLLLSLIGLSLYGFSLGTMRGGFALLLDTLRHPLLFFLSFFLCFPSLYIIGAFHGLQLTFRQVFTLMLLFLALFTTMLLAFMPVNWFFITSSHNADFLLICNFLFYTIAATVGIKNFLVAYKQLEGSSFSLKLALLLALVFLAGVSEVMLILY
jgi:hypothetical protein